MCVLLIIIFSLHGINSVSLVIFAILLSVPVSRWHIIRRSFLWITATDSGLQVSRFFGSNQAFTWDDIVRVAAPRFSIPADTTYVYAQRGRKLVLPRNMDGYGGLLDLIQSRARNVGPGSLPRNLWRREPFWKWSKVLMFFGLFVVYVATRAIAGF